MRVIDLGRGLRGIVAEPQKVWEDSALSMNRCRLRRAGISEETIERWVKCMKARYGVDLDERDGDLKQVIGRTASDRPAIVRV